MDSLTRGQSQTSSQPMLPGFITAISLPELADGQKPCDLPIGQQTDHSGLAHVPANHSARPENKKPKQTTDISGPNSSGSFARVDLNELLANKCRKLLGTDGSTIFRQTWKRKATKSGRSYWEHIASAHRTGDSDCIGWPTATTNESRGGRNRTATRSDKDSRHHDGLTLLDAVSLACWRTPEAANATQGAKHVSGSNPRVTLTDQTAAWATPAARDHKSESATETAQKQRNEQTRGKPLSWQVLGATSNGSDAAMEKAGLLNPEFSCWLMGFQIEWLSYMDLATP